jgi:hypothetical protein
MWRSKILAAENGTGNDQSEGDNGAFASKELLPGRDRSRLFWSILALVNSLALMMRLKSSKSVRVYTIQLVPHLNSGDIPLQQVCYFFRGPSFGVKADGLTFLSASLVIATSRKWAVNKARVICGDAGEWLSVLVRGGRGS